MRARDTSNWYEAGLPVWERKRRGHFSTPPALVEHILDACGYTPQHDLSHLRILDPACGSGNFLSAAARRLLLSTQQRQLTPRMQRSTLQHNLWGFDPDPIACFLAEMQLRSVYQQYGAAPQAVPRFHILQGDGLAFPWQGCQDIDLFLANPPYLAAKNTDLTGYNSARQRGQVDSYLLFLNLALQVVRPGGWLALVLPDSLLARAHASQERQRLLSETTIHHLWHLSGVFPAHVGAVVLIAQKHAPPHDYHVPWIRAHWRERRRARRAQRGEAQYQEKYFFPYEKQNIVHKTVPLTLLLSQPRHELCYLLGELHNSLVRRIYTYLGTSRSEQQSPAPGFVHLSDLCMIRRGEELSKESPLLAQVPPDEELQQWHPVLRGGSEIRPYLAPEASVWLPTECIVKSLKRYLQPKLIIVKSTDQLQATLDLEGHVVLQTLYLLTPKRERATALLTNGRADAQADAQLDELYFLLAVLNSRLLREYIYVLHTAYKWVQPQIEQHVLAHLPIPNVDAEARAEIVARAKQLLACRERDAVVELEQRWNSLYEEQEQAICALYTAALQERSTIPFS